MFALNRSFITACAASIAALVGVSALSAPALAQGPRGGFGSGGFDRGHATAAHRPARAPAHGSGYSSAHARHGRPAPVYIAPHHPSHGLNISIGIGRSSGCDRH